MIWMLGIDFNGLIKWSFALKVGLYYNDLRNQTYDWSP